MKKNKWMLKIDKIAQVKNVEPQTKTLVTMQCKDVKNGKQVNSKNVKEEDWRK